MDLILDYDDFKIYYNEHSGHYYCEEYDQIFRVTPVLKITYDVNSNVDIEFDIGDYCGEQVTDDNIIYWGFEEC
jgi:hypothetical protein